MVDFNSLTYRRGSPDNERGYDALCAKWEREHERRVRENTGEMVVTRDFQRNFAAHCNNVEAQAALPDHLDEMWASIWDIPESRR